MKTKLEAKEKELATNQTATKFAKEEAQVAQKLLAETKAKLEAKEKELASLCMDLVQKKKEIEQERVRAQDGAQENELVLLQLAQVQEELVEYSEKKNEIEKLYYIYKGRYERVEKRLPQYSDYGDLQIIKIDGASDNPVIIWSLNEFAIEGNEPNEFIFALSLHDGHPGIGLVINEKPQTFSPKFLGNPISNIFFEIGFD
jgi:hypothetical protein